MPVTLRGTDILFNDSTTQSTAAISWPGVYTGSAGNNASYPIGTNVWLINGYQSNNEAVTVMVPNSTGAAEYRTPTAGNYVTLAGTWRGRGNIGYYASGSMVQRVA